MNWLAILLAVVAALGCKDTSKKKADPEKTSDPWASAPKEPDTPEARKKRAEAAMARVAQIQPKLAKLRGLAFDRPVPVAQQSTDEFRAYLRREIEKELPPKKAKAIAAALLHIGLFEKPIDLVAALEKTFASQAAAYYDPTAKKFFLVMVPQSDMMLDTMSAHELVHGLQDQRFDLTKYLTTEPDDDASAARRFVVEGDATFTMMLYLVVDLMKSDTVPPKVVESVGAQLENLATKSVEDFGNMMKDQSAFFDDPEMKQAMAAIGELPRAIVAPMFASYMQGAVVSHAAYQQGGWPLLDGLYKDPPASTEQVLHPTTKLFPTRDHPQRMTLPVLDGEVLYDNVLGELQWKIYFELWAPDRAVAASEGWDGDRYTVVRRASGAVLAYLATVWDTAADARDFAAAYDASLGKRFPTEKRKILVKTVNTRVYILDGDDDAALLDGLIAGTKVTE